jgi:hypothetical protein
MQKIHALFEVPSSQQKGPKLYDAFPHNHDHSQPTQLTGHPVRSCLLTCFNGAFAVARQT